MKCPVDGETLSITERGGVEIDYCPKCRGVWLDRGELDKIIERSDGGKSSSRVEGSSNRRGSDRDDDDRFNRSYTRYSDDDDRAPNRRREHWLSDLFDF